jgi:hypothetical protein
MAKTFLLCSKPNVCQVPASLFLTISNPASLSIVTFAYNSLVVYLRGIITPVLFRATECISFWNILCLSFSLFRPFHNFLWDVWTRTPRAAAVAVRRAANLAIRLSVLSCNSQRLYVVVKKAHPFCCRIIGPHPPPRYHRTPLIPYSVS